MTAGGIFLKEKKTDRDDTFGSLCVRPPDPFATGDSRAPNRWLSGRMREAVKRAAGTGCPIPSTVSSLFWAYGGQWEDPRTGARPGVGFQRATGYRPILPFSVVWVPTEWPNFFSSFKVSVTAQLDLWCFCNVL